MLSKLRNWYFTSKKRLLPVISNVIRYIEIRIDLTIHFPTYFSVVISLKHYPCITYSAFLRYHAFKLHGVVYTVQKCMLRYSTYISLREGPNLCLSVWFTSFWVVLGIQHLHLCLRSLIFVITETFGHTLRIMACTGTATGNVSMYIKKFKKKKKKCPIFYSEALPMYACLALPLNHTITCDNVIPR